MPGLLLILTKELYVKQRKGKACCRPIQNQNKSIREIAQEARMSFRDIGAILKKAEEANNGNAIDDGKDNKNNKSANEKTTQAYKLFSEGKKIVEVSIELDIRENEASKYFREYLKLKGQDEVYEIYLENKHHIKSLRKLHRVVKREGITTDNIEWFVNMVKLGTYKIPELQTEYAKLKDELEKIDHRKVVSKYELENMSNQITILRRILFRLSATCNNKRNEISCLQYEIQQQEGYLSGLRSNSQQQEIENETYR